MVQGTFCSLLMEKHRQQDYTQHDSHQQCSCDRFCAAHGHDLCLSNGSYVVNDDNGSNNNNNQSNNNANTIEFNKMENDNTTESNNNDSNITLTQKKQELRFLGHKTW